MKTPLLLLLLLLTFHLIAGLESIYDVIGYSGSDIIIYCTHTAKRKNQLYVCKLELSNCEDLITSASQVQNTWVHNERSSLIDFSGGVMLIYRNLSTEDGGEYQCGELTEWSHDLNLKVINNSWCNEPTTLTAQSEENVMISCIYPAEFRTNSKFFCKSVVIDENKVVYKCITENQDKRLSISDDRQNEVFRVTIRGVREDDGGVYYCAVGGGGRHVQYQSLLTKVLLHVPGKESQHTTKPPSPTPITSQPGKTTTKPKDGPSSPSDSVIITVCVCVTLLIVVILLTFCKLRRKDTHSAGPAQNQQERRSSEMIHTGNAYEEIDTVRPDTDETYLYSVITSSFIRSNPSETECRMSQQLSLYAKAQIPAASSDAIKSFYVLAQLPTTPPITKIHLTPLPNYPECSSQSVTVVAEEDPSSRL